MSATPTNIVVIADVTAKPGHEASLRKALETAVKDTRTKDGCLVFRLQQDTATPGHFVLYELWRDVAAVDAHHASAQFAALMEGAKQITESAQLYRLRPITE